ncbi:spirocyclase AveC family protein [Mycobacterium sp. 21AC1]|uniref:spirocyclase AveC family protein n=1 Tax=[Mycobacterium] appelbergii TaxID=2939269 RepID=UPI00293938C1|nr:spirocyclase AveC family protein [Mycobacterium sp. 21AC1]MDV3128582.1 spirocyclase AveC family protein [Mycobacterium sp. 21AC1]
MSDLSNKKKPPTTESLGGAAAVGAQVQPTVKPVQIWAVVGGALLALQLYVWISWISGPYFERVPGGIHEPPLYMKIPMIANAVVLWVGLPFAIWWFFIRPWRRERRITLDGMLFVSMGLMFFQDPLLNYFNTWCTYNTWSFNRGSWSSSIPGWVSPEEPGRQVAEPLLTNVPGYAYGVLLITIVGCWLMRKIKNRWPNISNLRLILATYAMAFVFDFIMEALVMLPIGFYTYPGAIRSVSFNAGTYYQWPIYEGLMWGGVQAALCCLRFFTDDRGRTVVERGIDRVRGGFAKQQFVRFLAIFAGVSACFFFFYNLPAQWIGMHSDPWPEDHMKRSYFTGGICGDGTDTPCPDPVLPIPTKRSGFINTDGQLVLPEGAQLPTVVPFMPEN